MATSEGWYAASRVSRRHLGDVAHVVRERLAVDHRVGVVEDHRAADLGQLAGEQPLLLVLQLDLEVAQLLVGVDAAHDREAVFGEERLEPVVLGRE